MAKPDNNVTELTSRRHELDEQVLERLYREHGSALRAFLWGRVSSQSDAEDIIQEVFSRLARLDGLKEKLAADRSDNRAFIFTAANNYIVDQERRKTLERRYLSTKHDLEHDTVLEITPEATAMARQELIMVKQAIANLHPAWRRAFVLSRFDSMSYRQIAEEMNISVKTVEKYITRALAKLRDVMCKAHQAGGK
jgi:RNA polymerase sigma-19 factor, ECF subfamily